MSEREESRNGKTLGARAKELADRIRDSLGEILEALDDLVTPLPAPTPIPVRHRPRRR